MTSPPQPTPGESRSAGQYLRPLRDLAAWALVAAPAVLIFVALVRLIPDGPNQFEGRTMDSFYGFVNVPTIFFPLAAVLLALLVTPRHPKARLVVLAAVIEYAVMAFFGVVFGLLIGLINHAVNSGARTAFEELLVRLAWLAVFAVAGYAVFEIWRAMFVMPAREGRPNYYGQPQFGTPGMYPGQPSYGPPSGQPHPGQPGQPGQPGHPGHHTQPGFSPPGAAQPGQYGQPQPGQYGQPQPGQYGQPQPGAYGQPAPPWHQQPTPLASAPAHPAPAPPGPFAPEPGHAHGPAPYAAVDEPPAESGPRTPPSPGDYAEDRTEWIGEARPGFGPADGDQHRQ